MTGKVLAICDVAPLSIVCVSSYAMLMKDAFKVKQAICCSTADPIQNAAASVC